MSWEEFNKVPHTINAVIDKWAEEKPDKVVLIFYDTEKKYTFKEFRDAIIVMAFKLYNFFTIISYLDMRARN
jgi:acyl-CoA synthetase (AMP-forming)/AMP-acid ligase II